MTDVVVTGLGAITPLGGTAPESWKALLAGTSGARALPSEWKEQYGLPVEFAAQVVADVEDVLPRVQVKRLDRTAQFALVSAKEAWADAATPEVDPTRLAVVMGTGIGGVVTVMNQWDVLREKGTRRVSPLTVPMLMPNAGAAAVSLELGARGASRTPVSACASGAEAVATGLEILRRGEADVVVVGGSESCVHPMPMAGFSQMQALSTRNDSPTTASRPYDTDRDGFVLGEGGGALVLETAEHAAARGARVYARVLGAGMTSDAHHIAAPEPEGVGAGDAMTFALRDAGVRATDVVHVNAHATSTPVGDVAESKAIRRAFGSAADGVAVSGTKSLTGHLLGGAGAVESVLTVMALHERTAPATANIDTFDEAIDLDVVRGEHRPLPQGDLVALNNSFGFGGHNVAIAFGSAS
ncbi:MULTISPECIES: beta-ketoacyl-[acyl-carrier-protein] synthase family protein [Kytococcus]|uniref:3-oxoacyl-[acyl-carrier-protein] synthase 2 n=1 Tax=Kytococcus schroeteri TaxID=138300 RepID=A0A2I1PB55_9MICO|nr:MULTISPECIES: beta-ketoacyl-[acyl-carrier-protein] synthase family protein [Kytococcus]OFS15879.1 beta-ketoacyl-[acyl-carrier-protein] synthase II [Kytococcus sp. HMSC28H12]PKZ41869.1 beta-ketoacyl-[acyl-carrier-protein] synthase family protein [Kytococcus schroeteri]